MTYVVAVIPALNESASIARVVTEALEFVDHVIVVDDGSVDGTADLATAAGAVVMRHPHNRGVGSAVASGLGAACEAGAEVIVQVDGDGQHDPAWIRPLTERIQGGADFVVGTRFENGFQMGVVRRTILRGFGWMISRRIGVRITDPTSGFRAFSTRAADVLAPIFPRKYLSDTVETLFVAHELGLRIETVPVVMHHRQGGESSVGIVHGVGYTLRMAAIVVRHWLHGRR
jgi:glycosyltransferase involved in cell wall biosynthesis